MNNETLLILATLMLIMGIVLLGIRMLLPSDDSRLNRWQYRLMVLFGFGGALLFGIFKLVAPPPQESQVSPAAAEQPSVITLEGCMHQIPPSVMQEDGILQNLYRWLKPAEGDSSQSVEERRFHTYIKAFYGGELCLGEQGTPATLR
ncbi:MAG TPA: hypothetical protein VJC16_00730 [Candidatus Nanoarchaeia archaeon]|nr:hypothetical protein [Candidatus Nanoarchaeia archaeon]